MSKIRQAIEKELGQLIILEQAATTYPWNQAALEGSFRAGDKIYLLEENRMILGYAVLSSVLDEAELLNYVIAKSAQKRGVGTQFLLGLLQRDELAEIQRLYLEVRASNRAAIRLYKKVGFERVGLREGYYSAGQKSREDAVLMVWRKN